MELHPDEPMFIQRLKESGLYQRVGAPGRLTVQVFLASSEPISARDILYAAKRFDPMVSKGAVLRIMNALAECGLVTAIKPDRHQQPVKYARAGVSTAVISSESVCGHRHVICKDCGAEIEQPSA